MGHSSLCVGESDNYKITDVMIQVMRGVVVIQVMHGVMLGVAFIMRVTNLVGWVSLVFNVQPLKYMNNS